DGCARNATAKANAAQKTARAEFRGGSPMNGFVSLGIRGASLAFLLGVLSIDPAAAGEVSFAGKTITMTIGFGAGGSVDLYGRTLGQYLTQHLPGHPALVVLNQLGAGRRGGP